MRLLSRPVALLTSTATRHTGLLSIRHRKSLTDNFRKQSTMTDTDAAAKDIAAPPAAGQVVEHDGKRYSTIKEGLAHILVPESAIAAAAQQSRSTKGGGGDDKAAAAQQVFYNPIQQFNRDLSVLAIKAYATEQLTAKKQKNARRMEHMAGKKRKRQEQKAQEGQSSAAGGARKQEKLEGQESVSGEGHATEEKPAAEDAEKPTKSEPVDDIQASSVEDVPAATDATEHSKQQPLGPKLRILDALSATGLRALRYAHELPFNTIVTANDLLEAATESIKLNVKHNRLEDKINVSKGDALAHMYTLIAKELTRVHECAAHRSEKYDVIDLDPYGTAATFFDAALQSVRDDGGLLCVTCTDAGVWASQGYPEKTFALYGGVPMKGLHSHEAGLRIILHGIASSAARYGLTIEPLLSLSIDFYCRVFIRVTKSPASVKFQAGKTMVAYSCDQGCGSWTTQPLLRNRTQQNKSGVGVFYKHSFAMAPVAEPNCEHCGMKTHLAGPMYAGRIHSPAFVESILKKLPEEDTEIYKTTERIRGMLQTALEECVEIPPKSSSGESAPADSDKMDVDSSKPAEEGNKQQEEREERHKAAPTKTTTREDELAALDPCPFFFLPTQAARVLHCQTPGDDAMRGALRRLGYEARRSHCRGGSIKTDAPWAVIWEIMREWVRQKAPVREDKIRPGTAAYVLLGLGEREKEKAEGEGAGGGEGEGEGEVKGGQVKKSKLEVVFDEKLGREKDKGKIVRYQMNPRENWGPMNRARGN